MTEQEFDEDFDNLRRKFGDYYILRRLLKQAESNTPNALAVKCCPLEGETEYRRSGAVNVPVSEKTICGTIVAMSGPKVIEFHFDFENKLFTII